MDFQESKIEKNSRDKKNAEANESNFFVGHFFLVLHGATDIHR